MVFTIYYDSKIEANQFQSLSPELKSANLVKIVNNQNFPEVIRNLLRYDKPDIILVKDEKPVLVVEWTKEVATGHNAGQRFGRLACASEEGVMSVYFVPWEGSKKNGDPVWQPQRFFSFIESMRRIHNVPALTVRWATNTPQESLFFGGPKYRNRQLIEDGGQLSRENGNFHVGLSELIQDLITNDFDYKNCQTITCLLGRMHEWKEKLNPAYNAPPDSVQIIPTEEYLEVLEQRLPNMPRIPATFRAREKTIVYTTELSEEFNERGKRKVDREDPIVGNQFQYDYQFCRNGINPNQKYANLVLNLPFVHREIFEEVNPNDPNLKSRMWYTTANLLEFTDDIIVNNP